MRKVNNNVQGLQRNMTLEATFAPIKDSKAVLNQIKLINIEILIGVWEDAATIVLNMICK